MVESVIENSYLAKRVLLTLPVFFSFSNLLGRSNLQPSSILAIKPGPSLAGLVYDLFLFLLVNTPADVDAIDQPSVPAVGLGVDVLCWYHGIMSREE